MTDDANANSHTYVVGSSNDDAGVVKGYVVESTQGVQRVDSYAISGTAAGPAREQAYVVMSNPASVMKDATQVVSRNDVSVQTETGYAVLRSMYPPYEGLSLDYPFCDHRFPETISFGSTGGPGFKTSVFKTDSGMEVTSAIWDRIRATYSVSLSQFSAKEMMLVQDFFYAMRGRAIGFRYKDWSDYQLAHQTVLIGDGSSRSFQLFKRYLSGGHYFDRMIRKPVDGTVDNILMDGEPLLINRDFFVNKATGVITFQEPPARGVVGVLPYAEFDVPVRFNTDSLDISLDDFDNYNSKSIEMIEINV